jgi:hypothetical protein
MAYLIIQSYWGCYGHSIYKGKDDIEMDWRRGTNHLTIQMLHVLNTKEIVRKKRRKEKEDR